MRAQTEGASTPSPFPGEGAVASATTLEALELTRALELVAGLASGPLGADRVRARRPDASPAAVAADLEAIAEALALEHRGAGGEGLAIAPVPPIAPVLTRLRIDGSVLDGHELVLLQVTLAAIRQVGRELRRAAPESPRIAALLTPPPDKAIEPRLERSLDPEGEVLDAASPVLAAARREVHAARERIIRKLEAMLKHLDPQAVPAGASVTVRNGRYVIPVRRDSRARPQGIVHDESGSAGTLFIEPTDAIEGGNALREAIQEEARQVHRVLRELTELVRPEVEAIALGHEMCVRADDLQARTRYAKSTGAAVPAVAAAPAPLVLHGARHPVLLARLPATVPFDLVLDAGERTLVVSGPNAGGKTVLLKAIGLAVAMVQCGIVPPLGPGSRIPVFSRLFADIGDHQSIAADLSTFSAHTATLVRVLNRADRSALVLLDEVGSGTDPAEGGALAWAVLEELNRRETTTVATTHLGALKSLATEEPGVVNGSLEFDAATLAPSYRFTKGVPGSSYGIAIARRLGVQVSVVERAEARVPREERQLDALLRDAERMRQELGERELEVTRTREALEAQQHEAQIRMEDVERRERAVRDEERAGERKAAALAQEYLKGARQQVEEAIAMAADAERAREARRAVEDALQAARAIEQALTAARSDGATTGTLVDDLAPGVRVRLQGGGIGTIESVRDDGRMTVLAGSARLVVPMSQATEVLPAPDTTARAHAPGVEAAVERAEHQGHEIDLRGMRVDEAEAATLAALDAAVLADQGLLRIIHGKGTGALSACVRDLVRNDRRVAKSGFAPSNQGGSGVTVVELAR